MTKEEHKKIHIYLHHNLDLLVADYMLHAGLFLSKSSIMDLIYWSYEQTIDPTGDK